MLWGGLGGLIIQQSFTVYGKTLFISLFIQIIMLCCYYFNYDNGVWAFPRQAANVPKRHHNSPVGLENSFIFV